MANPVFYNDRVTDYMAVHVSVASRLVADFNVLILVK